MQKLDEIFKDKEEVILAGEILDCVRDSPFARKGVGVPSIYLTDKLRFSLRNFSKAISIQRNILRLVEENYLKFHPYKDYRNRDTICLTEEYNKTLKSITT